MRRSRTRRGDHCRNRRTCCRPTCPRRTLRAAPRRPRAVTDGHPRNHVMGDHRQTAGPSIRPRANGGLPIRRQTNLCVPNRSRPHRSGAVRCVDRRRHPGRSVVCHRDTDQTIRLDRSRSSGHGRHRSGIRPVRRRRLCRRHRDLLVPCCNPSVPRWSCRCLCPVRRGVKREVAAHCWAATCLKYVRRCPTLPQGPPCSTIGAESLSFRVRNVTGRFPLAMAAETLWIYQV